MALISSQELQSVEADFGDGPVTVYWRPMSLRDMDMISMAGEKSKVAGVVEALIVRARKADGSKMYDHRDGHPDRVKIETEFEPGEVIRVVNAMTDDGGESGN